VNPAVCGPLARDMLDPCPPPPVPPGLPRRPVGVPAGGRSGAA